MGQLPLSHVRQHLSSFPTPRMEDRIITQVEDIQRPKNADGVTVFPAKGDPHPDSRFPNHRFAHAEKASDDGQKYFFHYIAEREEQDTYNWEFTEADIGGTKFNAVTRDYLVLREDFSPLVSMGSLMPNTPTDVFSGSYVLAERKQIRANDPIVDSLFVIDRRVYVVRSTMSEVRYDEATGRGDVDTTDLYYSGESLGGTTVNALFDDPTHSYWGLQTDGTIRSGQQLSTYWFAVKTASVIPPDAVNGSSNSALKRIVERVTPSDTDIIFMETGAMPTSVPAIGSAHYASPYSATHKLSYIEPADKSGLLYNFYYVATRASEDEYNWEFTKADIGGNKFDAVKRTYVTLRSAFDPATPAAGAAMANVPSSKFPSATSYVLASREQVRTNERRIDNLFVIDVRVYVLRTLQRQIDYDERFGDALLTEQVLYYATESVGTTGLTAAQLFAAPTNAYWGLQSSGIMREGRQLSSHWYAISSRAVVPSSLTGETGGRTYYTTVDYSWPAVLGSIEIDAWNRKDGGSEDYVRPVFTREAYRGPCSATVIESFSKDSPTNLLVDSLQPLPINISTPMFSISIGPTLHVGDTLTISTGTGHPIYEYTGGDFIIDATNETDWPPTLVIEDSVSPFRGGYLRRTVTIDSPA